MQIKHTFQALQVFSLVNVSIPNTSEEIDSVLVQLLEKKKEYDEKIKIMDESLSDKEIDNDNKADVPLAEQSEY